MAELEIKKNLSKIRILTFQHLFDDKTTPFLTSFSLFFFRFLIKSPHGKLVLVIHLLLRWTPLKRDGARWQLMWSTITDPFEEPST